MGAVGKGGWVINSLLQAVAEKFLQLDHGMLFCLHLFRALNRSSMCIILLLYSSLQVGPSIAAALLINLNDGILVRVPSTH
jgi:hypothetical protein